MAHSRIPHTCDRCGGPQQSLRRFCKDCRTAMQPMSNEYNRNNHGFSGLVSQQNMEYWYFWAKTLLVDRKGMPETFERHVAHLVKHYSFQVPPPDQQRARDYKKEAERLGDIAPSQRKHRGHR